MRIKKVLVALMAITMLAGFIPAPGAYAAPDYSYIKVRLDSMGSVTSVQFKANGTYYIKENPYYPLVKGSTYYIKTSGSGVKLVDGSTETYIGTTATFVRCADSSSTNWLTINHPSTGWTNYPGDMAFTRNGSYIAPICTLFMEDYLVGVVAHEMSPSWPAEALKTQAIAARTYAMRYIASGNTYDVVDTTSNQVYKGYDPSTDGPVVDAINATTGIVLLWNGSFADGVYSASNGGQTMTRVPKWGSVNYYHQLKDDPYDIKNPASPKFQFLFPKSITTTNTLDSRLNTMLKSKVSSAISVAASNITIVGINGLTPHTLPSATSYGSYPAGSYQFTKIAVKVAYDTSGSATIPAGTTTTSTQTTGTVKVSSSSRLRIRSGPSTDSSIVGYAANGVTITVYEQRSDGWYKISYNGLEGYVYGSYVTLNAPAVTATPAPTVAATATPVPDNLDGTVNLTDGSGSINVYNDDDVSSTVIGTVPNGASLTVVHDLDNGWLYVNYNNLLGYVIDDNVDFSGTKEDDSASSSGDGSSSGTSYPEVTVDLLFSDLQTAFASDSSYLKYHKLLYVEESSDGKSWLLIARRFGHGIGMSQRGAQQMAKEGWTYTQILNFYYNGCTLQQMTLTRQSLPTSTAIPSAIGKVTCDSLNVRSGPGTSYSVVTSITKGTEVYVIINDPWCKVYVPSKQKTGYISRDYLDITEIVATATPIPSASGLFETHEGIYKVTASLLNFRSQPVIAVNVISQLTNGTLVTRIGSSQDFYNVKLSDGTTGWCSSKYLEMVSPAVTPTPSPAAMSGAVDTQDGSAVSVYNAASSDSLVIGSIPDGGTFTILEDRTDGWLYINYNNLLGYVIDDDIVFDGTKEGDADEFTNPGTTQAAIDIYESADLSSTIKGQVPSGTTVEIIEDRTDGWLQIEYNNINGYVIDDNMSFTGSKEDITQPTQTPESTSTLEPTQTPGPTQTPESTQTLEPSQTTGPTQTPEPSQTTGPTQTPQYTHPGTAQAAISIYESPNTSSTVKGQIPSGTTVEIIEDRTDGWLQIKYGDINGYVLDDNMSFTGSKEDADTGSNDDNSELTGTVATSGESVRIRNDASLSAMIIGYAPNGSEVIILEDRDDGWVYINYNNLLGYVVDDYIDFKGTKEDKTGDSLANDDNSDDNTDTQAITGTVKLSSSSSTLRIRSSASASASILGHVPNGATIEVIEQLSSGWIKMQYNGITGYVSGDYVDIEENSVVTGTISNCTWLNVRSGPNTSYSSLGMIQSGTSVILLESSDGWYKINYNGQSGWISGKYVSVSSGASTTTTTSSTGKVTASSLRVRSGPGLTYSQLGLLSKGAQVTIVSTSGDWYKINYSSTTGYVSKTYIQLT